MTTVELGTADAAVLETFVVPRYLALFGEPAIEALLPTEGARVAHLGCRTGYPDAEIAQRMPMSNVVGADSSASAVDLARAKAQLVQESTVEYTISSGFPTPLPSGIFSHALSLHPLVPTPEDRAELLREVARLLAPGGQLVLALPLRGSFQEVFDLVREFALKNDAGEIGKAAEAAMLLRPTIESLTDELESAGFDDVDVVRRRASLEFQSGRDFFEDPVTRLVVLPDVRGHLAGLELAPAFAYVRDAIDRYWSETRFDLSLHIGCVTARVPGLNDEGVGNLPTPSHRRK